MSQRQYLGIIVLTLFILGGTFYWFQYRPAKIRAKCLAEAEFTQSAIMEFNDSARKKVIDNYYDLCLKRFGL